VDCTGTIISKDFEGESLWVKVKAPPELMKYVVPKGFVAVDGTSLTVCEVGGITVASFLARVFAVALVLRRQAISC
jgi:riboflavin synthase alpha subunit